MENSETDDAANESKVVEMFRIDARVRIDLKGVIVVCGVFKQAKVRMLKMSL